MGKTICRGMLAAAALVLVLAAMLALAAPVNAATTDVDIQVDYSKSGLAIESCRVTVIEPGKTIRDVVPGNWKQLKLVITRTTDLTADEKKALEGDKLFKDKKILSRKYYQIDLYADDQKVTTLKDGGLDIEIQLQSEKRSYLLSVLGKAKKAFAALLEKDLTFEFVVDTGSLTGLDINRLRFGLFEFSIRIDMSDAIVKGLKTVEYTGKAIRQDGATVRFLLKTLERGTDYTISYKNNKKVGTATVTYTGKGNYTGSTSRTFRILPAKAAVKTLTPKTGALTVTLRKKPSAYGTAKVQVRYKVRGTKSWTTRTMKNKTFTLKKLKQGKRYDVQVRAYKSAAWAGKWSSRKTSGKIR